MTGGSERAELQRDGKQKGERTRGSRDAIDIERVLLFRSSHEAIVDKPAGLASEARGAGTPSVLGAFAAEGYGGARLPHRLDAVTGGVLVVALDREAAAWHGREIAGRSWRKLYVARIPAAAAETSPGHETLIGEHVLHLKREGRSARVVRSGGDRAVSRVLMLAPDPVNRRARQALVEIETGRYHQIRITLSHLGVPLIGDGLYGGSAGELLLEHAALRLRLVDGDRPRWFRSARSRDERGAVAPELIERLDGITAAS